MTDHHRTPPPAAVIVGVPLILVLVLALFAWPAARLEPRDVPVGVAGPAALRLPAPEGALEINRYADEAAARRAIREREVYGAVVAGPRGVTLLTASAASPVVAQLLQQALAPARPRVVDTVPAPEGDPRGAALGASVLPLIIAGVLSGVGVIAVARGPGARAGGLVLTAALAGLAGVAIAQGWLEALEGGWLANAGVLALVVLAVGATVAGAGALLGRAGIALAALVMILIGNPWSGITSAPELLPSLAGDVGALLPPGAGGTLLRSTAFFDGNGGAGALIVLLGWIALGLGMLAVAHARRPPVRRVA
jgi:hypothetical protein